MRASLSERRQASDQACEVRKVIARLGKRSEGSEGSETDVPLTGLLNLITVIGPTLTWLKELWVLICVVVVLQTRDDFLRMRVTGPRGAAMSAQLLTE